jgi:polysaccharide biosynthesis/export protein
MTALLTTLLTLVLQAAPPAAARTGPAADDYRIGVKDVIQVTIYGEETLSRAALTVDNDGAIDYPLIGLVRIAGLTPRQVEQDLSRRLGTHVDTDGREQGYLKNPNIAVRVIEFRSQLVWVQGAVHSPGAVTLKGGATLMNALSADGGAGPLTSDAGSYVLIIHAPEGQTTAGPNLPDPNKRTENEIVVSRRDIDMGKANAIRLRDGDTVFVPAAEKFTVIGEVRQSGQFVLTPDVTNVLKALALAGGVTDRGAKNRLSIQRVVNGQTVEIKVKETDPILAGDTLIVPKKRI